jgi:hypothetical protein
MDPARLETQKEKIFLKEYYLEMSNSEKLTLLLNPGSVTFKNPPYYISSYEEKFKKMEEERPDEVEMAEKKDEKKEEEE